MMNTRRDTKVQDHTLLRSIISVLIVIAVALWGYWGFHETLFAEKLVSAGRITAWLTGIDPDVVVTTADTALIGLTGGGGGQGRGGGRGAGQGRVSAEGGDAHTETGLSRHSIAPDWAQRFFAYAGVFFGIALLVYLICLVIPKWLSTLLLKGPDPPLS